MSFSPVVNMDAPLQAGDKLRFALTLSSLWGQTASSVAEIVNAAGVVRAYSVEMDSLIPPVITSKWRVVAVVQTAGVTPAQVVTAVTAAAEASWSEWSASVTELEQEVVGLPSVQPSSKTVVALVSVAVIGVVLWWFLG